MGIKCPKCQSNNPDTQQYCGECGTQLIPSEEISPTKTLKTAAKEPPKDTIIADKYKIIEKLGEGGMGIVYKAEDIRLKRTVALKFLPPELTRDQEAKERFVREAQSAAALAHPNICTIHEIDEDEGKSFIAMEYIEGQSVREKTKLGPLDLTEALNIAIQAAQGLKEAHEKGIIHRDIKSANIMVTSSGQAKIMDFGLAKMTGASLITKEATTMGTVAYMSPEQSQGKVTDQRTDIWSMGVVLYELMTGRLPFSGDHEQSVIYCILNSDPKPVVAIRNEVPKELDQVIGKALQKDPDERYQWVGDLLDDLRAIARGIEPFRLKEVAKRALKSKKSYLYTVIAALFILLAVAGVVLITGRSVAIDSIAVLPLENLSGDADQEYFTEGMHEALITELSKIKALKVISRPSVMRYKNSDKSLPEIAKELNVKGIIAGSALQEGEKVRISVQLIDAETERNLWAERYDKNYRDILVLHGEVAQDITQEIRIKLSPEEQEQLTRARKINPEAHKAYLKGRYFWNMWTADSLERSIEYFCQAIEKDPNFAPAYVGLANSYSAITQVKSLPAKELMAKASVNARKAVEIDDSLAEAHATLGYIKHQFEWDFEGAEMAFKKAIQINPNSWEAHIWYGQFLNTMGRHDEAIVERKRARELDPLLPFLCVNEAAGYLYSRVYDKAIEEAHKALELDPNFWVAHWFLGSVYMQKDMYEESVAEHEKALDLLGGLVPLPDLGYVYGVSGRREEAQKILDRLEMESKQGYIPPTYFASIYMGLGQKDRVFHWLEKAFEERDRNLVFIVENPKWDSLLLEPRFNALLKKMGLEK